MNNPETTRTIRKRIEEVPLSDEDAPLLNAKYTDSENGFPLAERKRFSADASDAGYPENFVDSKAPAEVAAARVGALVFSTVVLPTLLWISGSLGGTALLAFAVCSAIVAFRVLFADPGGRVVAFVGAQAVVTFTSVGIQFGVLAGFAAAFLLQPAGLLAAATMFGRAATAEGRSLPGVTPVELATARVPDRKRAELRVVAGSARSH